MRVVQPGHATETSSGETELACLDGELMASEAAQISVTDEGLLRGDGVFEVVRLYAGRPFGLEQHLERMVRSASNLRLPLARAGGGGPAGGRLPACLSTARGWRGTCARCWKPPSRGTRSCASSSPVAVAGWRCSSRSRRC